MSARRRKDKRADELSWKICSCRHMSSIPRILETFARSLPVLRLLAAICRPRAKLGVGNGWRTG